MESPDAIAQLVIQKDDNHSNKKIDAIQNLMMCARLTEEGSLQMESEIRFYESRKELNRMLIASGNEELIRINAINIIYKVLSETEIPSWNRSEDMKDYQETINEYSQYLEVISKG